MFTSALTGGGVCWKKINAESNPLTKFHSNLPSSSVPPNLLNQYALTTKLQSVYSSFTLKTWDSLSFCTAQKPRGFLSSFTSLVCILKRAANSSSFSNMWSYSGQLQASPHTWRASPCFVHPHQHPPKKKLPAPASPGGMRVGRKALTKGGSQTPGTAIACCGRALWSGSDKDIPPFVKQRPRPRHGAVCSYTRLPLPDSHTNLVWETPVRLGWVALFNTGVN